MSDSRIRAWPPAQMGEADAAYHVGAPSASTFRLWVERGLMPKGRKQGKYRLWKRADLDEAVDRMQESARDENPLRRRRHAYDPAKIAAARRNAALHG